MIKILIDHWKDISAVIGIVATICAGVWKTVTFVRKHIQPIKEWIEKHDKELEESIRYRAEARMALSELLPNGNGSIKERVEKISYDVSNILVEQLAQAQLSDMAIFKSDKNGYCTFVNKKWSELTGLSFSQAMGWGWLNAVHIGDRERVKQEWISALSANSEFNSEYRLAVKDEQGVPIKVNSFDTDALIHRDKIGNVISVIGTLKKTAI